MIFDNKIHDEISANKIYLVRENDFVKGPGDETIKMQINLLTVTKYIQLILSNFDRRLSSIAAEPPANFEHDLAYVFIYQRLILRFCPLQREIG